MTFFFGDPIDLVEIIKGEALARLIAHREPALALPLEGVGIDDGEAEFEDVFIRDQLRQHRFEGDVVDRIEIMMDVETEDVGLPPVRLVGFCHKLPHPFAGVVRPFALSASAVVFDEMPSQ